MARNMLDKAKSFVLMQVVQSYYVESKMTDVDFAAAFTEGRFQNVHPTFFPVTDGNIAGARKALGLESNYGRGGSEAARVAAEVVLEKLAKIEDKLERLLKYLSEQARRDL